MSKDTKPMLDKGTIRMGTVTKIVLALAIIILAVSLVISFVKPAAAVFLCGSPYPVRNRVVSDKVQ